MIDSVKFSDEFNKAFKKLKSFSIYDKQDMSNVAETFLDQLIMELDGNSNKIN